MATIRTFTPPPGECLYMLIDVTTPESTKVLKVANLKCVTLWGHIFKAQGKKVIAPPVDGRGFGKLDRTQMQYLYWDLLQVTPPPPEQYTELVAGALKAVQVIAKAPESFDELMREINRLGINLDDPTAPVPKAEKDPNAPPSRPKATTTTGLVWQLADEAFEAAGNQMPNRADVIAACEREGINASTAATQYAKWVKAKKATL